MPEVSRNFHERVVLLLMTLVLRERKPDTVHVNPGDFVHVECRKTCTNTNIIASDTKENQCPTTWFIRSKTGVLSFQEHCLFCGHLAFKHVVAGLNDNDDEQITVSDLVEKMHQMCGEKAYGVSYTKQRLKEYFGDSVIITDINGKIDVVTLRRTAACMTFMHRKSWTVLKQKTESFEKRCYVDQR